jgi:hypothetical protein
MLKYKQFLKKSLDKKQKDYRYNQILEKYKDKEKNILMKKKKKDINYIIQINTMKSMHFKKK